MRRTLPALTSTLAALAAAAGLLAAPSAAAEGRLAPALLSGRGEARISLASGERVAFPLPEGAELTAVAGAGGAWVAAGTRPVGASGRREILVVVEREGTAVPLPPPPGGAAPFRQEPVPLAEGDRLAGLAWLEGNDPWRLALRFAPWEGEGWGAVETVSARGPGSQLGLAAASLANGSWLLAWSAADGEDDEILWAVRSPDGAWSRPRRAAADNAVPDVTPALAAAGAGALLAWSRYDGEGYTVVVSRWRGGAWSAPRPAAESGSIFPTLEPSEGGARLLFRTAVPDGWGFAQLDAAGRVRRRAAVATTEHERPRARPGRDGVRFEWEGSPALVAPWSSAGPAPRQRARERDRR